MERKSVPAGSEDTFNVRNVLIRTNVKGKIIFAEGKKFESGNEILLNNGLKIKVYPGVYQNKVKNNEDNIK